MQRSRRDESALGACLEITERYPKYKRALKTLATAIDNYMRRNGFWNQSRDRTNVAVESPLVHSRNRSGTETGASSSNGVITILLYSKSDDRFDMVSLERSAGKATERSEHSSSKRKP
jgi:hypothetical protein